MLSSLRSYFSTIISFKARGRERMSSTFYAMPKTNTQSIFLCLEGIRDYL